MRKKRKKPIRRWIILILIVAVVFGWIIKYISGDKVSVKVARLTDFEDKITTSAVYVRNESVYESKNGGILLGRVSANTKVSSGTHVATLYTESIDERAKQEIEEINARIDTMEQLSSTNMSFSSDIASTESDIKKAVNEVVKMSQNRDLTGFEMVKLNLDDAADPTGNGAVNTTIENLIARRTDIENSISNSGEKIYASHSGIFIPFADGYESLFSVKNYDAITIEQINDCLADAKNIKSSEVISYASGESVCKTVSNSEWMLACVLSKEQTNGLKKGMRVQVRIKSADDALADAKVKKLYSDDGENFICILDVSEAVKNAYSDRVAQLEIIKKSYTGLAVPASALRFNEDGTPGVFVNSSGVARFRKINLLYSDDSIVVAENITGSGMLRMYDSVILDRDNIYDGKAIKQ